METLTPKLFRIAAALFLINVCGLTILSQSAPDFPESLGGCLGVYKINSVKVSDEFSDFDYFYLEEFPNQNIDNPKKDAQNRVFIRGKVKLTDGKILKIKRAFVRSINVNGDENYYKEIEFETKEVDGLSYKFKGEFAQERVEEEKGGYTKVKGNLAKYKNSKKVAENELKFFEYAIL